MAGLLCYPHGAERYGRVGAAGVVSSHTTNSGRPVPTSAKPGLICDRLDCVAQQRKGPAAPLSGSPRQCCERNAATPGTHPRDRTCAATRIGLCDIRHRYHRVPRTNTRDRRALWLTVSRHRAGQCSQAALVERVSEPARWRRRRLAALALQRVPVLTPRRPLASLADRHQRT